MKKNKIKLTLFLIVLLAMTACNNREVGNGNTNVAESTSQLASEIVPEAVFQFNAASGKVYAIKTAVLCLTPEKGSGYADFIFKGTEVTLKGIDESGTWSVVNYNGADYYILSSYLAAQSGEKLDEGGAEDMITGETLEVQIVTEVSEEGEVTTTVTVTKPTQEATTEISLEGSTSEETKPSGTDNETGNGSTMSNGTASNGSSSAATKPSESTSVKTTEAVTKAPKPTQTPKPTQAATQTPKPTQAATKAPKPTQATQTTTKSPVWHEPVYEFQRIWVVDKEAWVEEKQVESQVPIYTKIYFTECTCGFLLKETDNPNATNEWVTHESNHLQNEEPYAYRLISQNEIIGYTTEYETIYIDHPEEGHYEDRRVLISEGYWE